MSLRAAVLVTLLTGLAASALAAPPNAPPAAVARTLGDLTLYTLRDAEFAAPNDGKTFGVGPGVGPAKVAEVLTAAGAPADKISLSVDALLVKSGGRILLFDTGVGGVLLDSLALAGVRPDEVTDIFITHSHFDHIGGLTRAEGLKFPNATIHMSAREWAFLQTQTQFSRAVATISPKVSTFEPGAPIVPGVRAIDLYGHTPGHVAYEITSKGVSVVDIGDLAHSSILSLARPEWAMQYDADQVKGAEVRSRTVSALASRGQLIFAPHFPYPGIGVIAKAKDGYAFRPQP